MTIVLNARGAADAGPAMGPARGVVFIHSCPRAVSPHLEWALAAVFGRTVGIDWADQPIAPGTVRAELIWGGPQGTGARIASALQSFRQVRHEVTEDPSAGVDGQRFCHTPQLGLWSGSMSANGDTMVGEMRLRDLMAAGADTLAAELDSVLGTAWDDALEPYRDGGDSGEVSWLSRGVG